MRPYLLALLLALTGLFVTAAPAAATTAGSCTFTTVTDTRVSGTCATGDQLFRVKAVFEVPAAGSGDFVTKYGAWVLPGSTSTAIRNPGFLRSAVFQKQ